MRSRTLRRILTLAALTLLSATLALPQSALSKPANSPKVSSLVDSLHYREPKFTNWNSLAQIDPRGKLFVVTVAQPTQRHICRVQSFAPDQLACRGPFGTTRIYKSEGIAALIVPGDGALPAIMFIGFNAALGASIWATIVLIPTCPVCAAGTGVAALFFFSAAGATGYSDDMPDRLLYLAPGQTLRVKLR